MEPDIIEVMFRRWPDKSVMAMFPRHIVDNPDRQGPELWLTFYRGKDGSANFEHVVELTRKATPEEYQHVLVELQTIYGDEFRFRVCTKRPRRWKYRPEGQ